jgi:phospholipase/carboxylesterase
MLSTIEINPARPPVGTVILMHGLGADGNDFVPVVSELAITKEIPLRFVFPNAPLKPVTVNNGYIMSAWFDIKGFDSLHSADLAGIQESVLEIQTLIAHEENLGVPADKIILAGFSQGAVIALSTGLFLKKRLAGILALSGYLPATEASIKEAATVNKQTPIFVGHGTNDNIVPYFLGKDTAEKLTRCGLDATFHSYNMGHSVSPTEINDISAWLKKIFVESE